MVKDTKFYDTLGVSFDCRSLSVPGCLENTNDEAPRSPRRPPMLN